MSTFFGVLCLLFGLLHSSMNQREDRNMIFFPREAPVVEPQCIAYDGKQGFCRLLVQCSIFIAEIAELSRSPCSITDKQQGVCCPKTKQQTLDPAAVAHTAPEPNRHIVFPPLSTNDLNAACEQSLNTFTIRNQFTEDLVNRKVVAEPGSSNFLHASLFQTTDEILEKGKNAAIVLEASKDLAVEMKLNKDQAAEGLSKFSVTDTIISDKCPKPPRCPDPRYSYRTINGACNNLVHKDWGKMGVTFLRMLLPDYQDGLSVPRVSVNNRPLPTARQVSTMISNSNPAVYRNLTNLIWQWGQFLDHDITHTPISKGAQNSNIDCCNNGQFRQGSDLHPECLPIGIPNNDKFFSKFSENCMEFVRSMPAVRDECKFGPREQMNQITSYIDASNVYGSTDDAARKLRTGINGELEVNMVNGRELLPGNDRNVGCRSKSVQEQCFTAGDSRVNEQPDLVVMHIVWIRQHNKIAKELHRHNPSWSDEILYQESRRIVGAQMQHITYNEYLPIILGREFMEQYGLLPLKKGYYRGYREDVDATISNSFAAAAFRYGHTLITDDLQGFNKFGMMESSNELSKTQFIPFALYQPGTLDSLIRGLSLQHSQKFDHFFSEELTNKLFAQHRPFGMDLVALNIQRGRDHGLPSYTKWRKVCNLPQINNWDDLFRDIDRQVIVRLQRIYASIHDIDLFIGGISENTVKGTLLGPTFLCIIGRQFIRLKIGDRFYYENGMPRSRHSIGTTGELLSSFSEAQLDEIRKTSLARILCDNSDEIELMQPLAFGTGHLANKRATCLSGIRIPRMSLEPWKNERIWVK